MAGKKPKSRRALNSPHHDLNGKRTAAPCLAKTEDALLDVYTAAESAMEGISKLDDSGRYVFVNTQYAALLGYRQEELFGQSWEMTVHGDDRASVRAALAAMLANGKAETDVRGVKKDGSLFYAHIVAVQPDTMKSNMSGHYCFVWDITERKREDAFLSAEKQALELVAKGAGLEEVLTYICRTLEEESVPMLTSIMLVTEDGGHLHCVAAPSLSDDYNQAVDGIPIGPTAGSCGSAAYHGKPSFVVDIATDPLWKDYAAIATKYGLRACWSQPILSPKGDVLGTFAAYYREPRRPSEAELGIVERAGRLAAMAIHHSKMSEALKDSESRFQAFMDHSPTVTFMKDEVGRHIYINSQFERLFGVTREEMRKKTVFDFMPVETAARLHQNDQLVFSSGQTLEIEEIVPAPNGTAKDWLVIKFPLDMRQGRLLGGVAIDITERKRAEEYLRRTRFAMGQAVDAVYWIDPQARILYTNDAASAMLGYTAEEFLRMTVHDLNPEFPPEVWLGWWAETREKKVISLETVHLTKDGRRIPIDIRVSFLAYGGQEFHCAFVRNITERKRIEAALQRAHEELEQRVHERTMQLELANRSLQEEITERKRVEDRLQATQYAVDHAADQIFVVGPNGYFLDVNESACRRLGYAKEELLTMSVMDIDPDFSATVWEKVWAELTGSKRLRLETRHRSKSGEIYPVEVVANYLQHNGRELDYAIVRDITERRRAEEAVRESELRYKLLTEATFDGIAIHDQGTLLEVNAGLERIFGYEPGELIGRSLWDLVADESRDLVAANMRNGVNGPYEAMGRRKDGTTFPGEVVIRPCRYRGKEVRLVAGRDITARKHLEAERSRRTEELEHQIAERTAEIAKLESQRAQAEKLAAMGRLAAGVAHEINNPIAGIKNAFALVRQAVDPAHPHAEFAGMIDREIARVACIVQNMYELYRPESGKGEAVELGTMMNDIQALFTKRLQQRRLGLLIDVDPGIGRLYVPRRDLLQVLLNLLNNAVDCSNEGGTITLTLRVEPEAIRIAVSDQGPGIPPENLPHIFDPFFTTKTGGDQKGMGLGLSISQSLVMAMGGKIEVQTRPNIGSTFSVLLPSHMNVACAGDQLDTKEEVVTHDD